MNYWCSKCNLTCYISFQEGDSKQALKNALRFDKVIKNIAGGVKKGIDLFMDIINGKLSIKDIIKRLITALKELPLKVMV